MKTTAAVLTKLNEHLQIMDLNIPLLQNGHVLVKINNASICGSQLLEIRGFKNNEKFLPHTMGHEGVGIIEDVGPGVTKVQIGNKVVMHWRKGSGIEAPFVKYDNVGSGKITTFCTRAIVSENRITKIPHNIPNEFGSLLGCALTTAYGAVIHDAQLRFGDDVLIIGCGGIGLSLIDACLYNGACNITALDINDKRGVIKPNVNFITKISNDTKYNIIFDTIGTSNTIQQHTCLLKDSGKYVVIGQTNPSMSIQLTNIPQLFGNNGTKIIFSQGGKTNPDVDIPLLCNMLLQNRIEYKHLITHYYNLKDINQAFQTLITKACGKIIITMDNI